MDATLPGGHVHMCKHEHTGLLRGTGPAPRRPVREPTSFGPGQTVSSEPGFHHFTWKDPKAPDAGGPAQPRPGGRGSFQQSGKRSRAATPLPRDSICIPDPQPASCAHPHWTDRETEAESRGPGFTEQERHRGREPGAPPHSSTRRLCPYAPPKSPCPGGSPIAGASRPLPAAASP